MSKVLFALVFLVAGVAAGFLAGVTIGVGGGTGMGVATGLSVGACGIANAAQDEGLLTPDQVDQVLNRAVTDLRALSPEIETDAEKIASGSFECDAVLKRFREAARTDS